MRTLQESTQGPEVIPAIGSSMINIECIQLALTDLKGYDKIVDEDIRLLCPHT
jgi:hypothetical protein